MPAAEYLKGLTWLGHASFKLVRGGVTIYFDPFQLKAEPRDADVILISHPHFDHLSPQDASKVAKAETTIVTVSDCVGKLQEAQVPGSLQVVKPGDKINVKGVSIEAVPAYNTNKDFHKKESGWVGFIVELDGVRIYHAGDTDFIPQMREFKTDVALLPVSGTYVMTADEAVEAAKAITPKVSVPMHYGSIVGTAADAKKFQALLSDQVVEILAKSEGP